MDWGAGRITYDEYGYRPTKDKSGNWKNNSKPILCVLFLDDVKV